MTDGALVEFKASLAISEGCGAFKSEKIIIPESPTRLSAERVAKSVASATFANALVTGPLHSELNGTVKSILERLGECKGLGFVFFRGRGGSRRFR